MAFGYAKSQRSFRPSENGVKADWGGWRHIEPSTCINLPSKTDQMCSSGIEWYWVILSESELHQIFCLIYDISYDHRIISPRQILLHRPTWNLSECGTWFRIGFGWRLFFCLFHVARPPTSSQSLQFKRDISQNEDTFPRSCQANNFRPANLT